MILAGNERIVARLFVRMVPILTFSSFPWSFQAESAFLMSPSMSVQLACSKEESQQGLGALSVTVSLC